MVAAAGMPQTAESFLHAIPIRFAIALVGAVISTAAFGQTYPTRPITLIVPYAAGGSVDAVARIVAPRLAERLGQNVVIENVAGAGGIDRHAAGRARDAGRLHAAVLGREHDGDRQAGAALDSCNTTARRISSRSR